jgi:hypothetical protein
MTSFSNQLKEGMTECKKIRAPRHFKTRAVSNEGVNELKKIMRPLAPQRQSYAVLAA